jgi:hypothetical protein
LALAFGDAHRRFVLGGTLKSGFVTGGDRSMLVLDRRNGLVRTYSLWDGISDIPVRASNMIVMSAAARALLSSPLTL